MERDIKTRRVVKDIKTLARRTGAASAAKEAAIKTRDAANGTVVAQGDEQSRPEDKAQTGGQRLASDGAAAAQRRILVKAAHPRAKTEHPRAEPAKEHAKDAGRKARREAGAQAPEPPSASASTEGVRAPTEKRKAGAASKQPKAAKHPKPPAKSPGQTPSQAPKPPTNMLQVIARRRGSARHVASHAPRAAKRAMDGAAAFARMAAASARSLSAALAALGGTALSTVVVVTLAGLVAASAFGIFFCGGDMGDGNPSLREMVAQLNKEHTERIEQIKTENPHDKVALTGTKTAWKEALAVYAVRTTTDADNPLDVVTLDAARQQLVKSVFWAMNRIDSRIEAKEVTDIVLEEDDEGNPVEIEKTVTEKILYIELSHTTADEAASAYGFNAEQADMLHQLLAEKNDPLWQSVLYGVGQGSGDMVEVAASQVGNVGGQPYWSWYGFGGRVEWCACFVSWCANECGYIEDGSVPKFAYCPWGVQWFKDAGRWQDRGYAPQPGDIVFFDWGGDGVSDHVGIVESCDDSTVHTIEGNSGDACQRNSYSINSASIMGYGTPIYQ